MPWAIAAVASSAVNEYAFVPGSLIVTTAILDKSPAVFEVVDVTTGKDGMVTAEAPPRYCFLTVNV